MIVDVEIENREEKVTLKIWGDVLSNIKDGTRYIVIDITGNTINDVIEIYSKLADYMNKTNDIVYYRSKIKMCNIELYREIVGITELQTRIIITGMPKCKEEEDEEDETYKVIINEQMEDDEK